MPSVCAKSWRERHLPTVPFLQRPCVGISMVLIVTDGTAPTKTMLATSVRRSGDAASQCLLRPVAQAWEVVFESAVIHRNSVGTSATAPTPTRM